MTADSSNHKLRQQLILFALIRTVINTGYRMVYPFIGALARGTGVDVIQISRAISLRSLLGMSSPLLGMVADRRGRKEAMLLGLGVYCLGTALIFAWPTYAILVIALLLMSAGKYLFDPAMQAYLGDRVSYRRRGIVIAITELGWSLAFIVGMPAAGFLIARAGWRIPFAVTGGLTLALLAILWIILPGDGEEARARQGTSWDAIRRVIGSRAAVAGLAVGLLISAANEVINIVYGVWLEDVFGLPVLELGAAAAVIGAAELGGEGLVAWLVDWLGKRRAVGIGIGLNALTGLLLPLIGHSIPGALIGLFLFYITFEFTLVALIPLMTELAPDARATLMAGNVAALSAGRALGALIGPGLFALGLIANGTAAVLIDGMALLAIVFFVRVEE